MIEDPLSGLPNPFSKVKMKKRFVVLMPVLLATAGLVQAAETNFTYSKVSGGGVAVSYDKPVCLGSVCYRGAAGAGAGFSFQPEGTGFVLSGNVAGVGNSNSNSSITSGSSMFGVAYVVPVARSVDIGLGIESVGTSAQTCLNGICSKASDSGGGLGLFINSWVGSEHRFSLQLGYESVNFTNAGLKNVTTAAFTVHFAGRHSIGLSVASQTNTAESDIVYSYRFY